jgi:hypothetical protein
MKDHAIALPWMQELWQRYDIDYQDDFDAVEYFLEKNILKGRGASVYTDYKDWVLSEFGFEQHASKYNQGVEQNLLPAEYRNSFVNHLPVYLETMKVPESIVGWELNELKKDDAGTISRRRMKLIKARNGTDVFAPENVLTERKPALIIGSGPSLDTALPLLKDWKGATFCSTSHASSLIYYGHEPSHMIAYDINTRPFEQEWVDTWEGRKTVMVTKFRDTGRTFQQHQATGMFFPGHCQAKQHFHSKKSFQSHIWMQQARRWFSIILATSTSTTTTLRQGLLRLTP